MKKDPKGKLVRGWKTILPNGREVSVYELKSGEYAIWFERVEGGKKITTGTRLSVEAALALLAILDKLLRVKLDNQVTCNWHKDEWTTVK